MFIVQRLPPWDYWKTRNRRLRSTKGMVVLCYVDGCNHKGTGSIAIDLSLV